MSSANVGGDAPVPPEQLRTKIQEYSSFVDETLHPQLQQVVAAREETEREIQEYTELRDKLQLLIDAQQQQQSSAPLESLVSLGHDLVYARAVVDDPSTILVSAGHGFHVELTLPEAVAFCERRISFLATQVLPKRVKEAQTVGSHVESSMVLLESLSRELQSMDLS